MRAKYGNKFSRCLQGVLHRSKLETKRCNELHMLAKCGQIRDLKAHPQPVVRLSVNGMLVCKIIPDFKYLSLDDEIVYEDTKGVLTKEWVIKNKLLYALHGIKIQVIR